MNLSERFWAKVNRAGPGDCWIWTAGVRKGYGRFRLNGQKREAHRVAFELTRGPIPDGLILDHLCHNRACCNPAHLEPTTQRTNILRGDGLAAHQARQTHCHAGHPLVEANVYRRPSRPNVRACRECARRKGREWARHHYVPRGPLISIGDR